MVDVKKATLKKIDKMYYDEPGYRVSIASYATARTWDGEACRQTGWAYGH